MKLRTATAKNKPKIEFSITVFKKLLAYCVSPYVNKTFIKKLNTLFASVDTSIYLEDVDIAPLYNILKLFIKFYYDEDIGDEELILEKIYMNKSIDEDDIDTIFDEAFEVSDKLKKGDAVAIENIVIDNYNYAHSIPHIKQLKNLAAKFEKGEYDDLAEMIKEMQSTSHQFLRGLTSKSSSNIDFPKLSFKSDGFKEQFKSIVRLVTDEKRLVKSGLQRFNKMLGGGFAPGRVYVFLGATGG